MLGIRDAALRFLDAARAGALGVDPDHLVLIPVPPRAVIQLGIADAHRRLLGDHREFRDERQLAIILSDDRPRFRDRLADHLGQLLDAGTVDLGEIDALGGIAIEPGHLGHHGVEVGIRIVAVGRDGLSRTAQAELGRATRQPAEFLLRLVGLAPDLTLFRQEHAADQRPQFLVANRHLLQRRI